MNPGDSLIVPSAVTEYVENRKFIDHDFNVLKYTLGADDVVQITVMDHPDFSGTYLIGLEGKIQYKFVGDMDVRGMTKGQLEDKIKKIISQYVISPEVNVTITEFKGVGRGFEA